MRELDVGRTPLREAVKRLALENLVAVRPRRGTFVTDVAPSDIVALTEVRVELEGYAAELAAVRSTPTDARARAALIDELVQLGRQGDQDGLMRFDERIHRFTWEAAGQPRTSSRRSSAASRCRCASGTSCSTACPACGHAVHRPDCS